MKISYNWLKEYIDIKESPERLADMLTNSGSEVKSIETMGGDSIMDIEITPNRPDCLNYLGIAREVSALTGEKVKIPLSRVKKADSKAPFSVEIKDKALCPRYTARLIKNVSVKGSPDWLKKKIIAMGLRPVNNIVDITNFVLFETGQPMHAFDYDKIKGGRIIIRRTADGEKIVSIDNVERRLEKDMLIIADSERPIAVAGVMGGLNTEVSDRTKDILLESAYFNPVSVRRTSYKLALTSESSYRFERSVDPGMVLPASDRAALLICEVCGGKIAELADKGERSEKERTVEVRIERLNKILNLKLTEAYVKKVLLALSLGARSKKKGIIKVSVPSFRQDIRYEIDIVEEVARIYGYGKIGTTIPNIVPNPEKRPHEWQVKEKAKDVLVSLGLSEVMTYGLTSKANLHKAFGFDVPETIAVKNYMSVDQELMRPSLLPGILDILGRNINRGIKDLKVFEIGNVYGKNLRYETAHLCIALTGLLSSDWQREKSLLTPFDLKGILDILFSKLGLSPEKIEITSGAFIQSQAPKSKEAAISYDKKYIGYLTILDNNILDAFDIKEKAFIAEIDLGIITKYANLETRFTGIPKYPSTKRDISLIVPGDISFSKIAALVSDNGTNLVENIELLGSYSGRQIPEGHKGVSFRIEYRDKARTLTSEEVDKVHFAIRDSLVEKLKVTLR